MTFWHAGQWCRAVLTVRGLWSCPRWPQIEKMLERECGVDELGDGYRQPGMLQLRRAAFLLAGRVRGPATDAED